MSIFGAPTLFGSSQASSIGTGVTSGFNPPASSQNIFGGFGFGANTSSSSTASKPITTFSGFGTNTSIFQGFCPSTVTTTVGLFGSVLSTPASTQSSLGLLSSQFNQPALGTTSGFSFLQPTQSLFSTTSKTPGFGFTTPLQSSTFQQQQPTIQQQGSVDAFFASLSQPMLFGDERDSVVARWNQLQAMWGTGVGYSATGVVTYLPENTFARFKAIGYNVLPTSTDADGLVCLYLSRAFTEVTAQRQGLQDTLFRLLGSRPTLQLVIEEIRPCAETENTTEVILKVVERQTTGTTTNIPASELAKYLSSPSIAAQLQSQLCANRLIPEVSPSAAQLAAYHENPPAGFDRLIWQQARLDNPRPDRMIPIPFIGFSGLRRRKLDQLAYGEQQSNMIKHINELVNKMQTNQLIMTQRVIQLKRKQIELSHRVLKVLKHQEVHQRSGFAISTEEEAMRCELERIWTELTAPRGLRLRFQEALTSLRASTESNSLDKETNSSTCKTIQSADNLDSIVFHRLDSDAITELKEYLTQRQNGLREMQRLIANMNDTLRIIEDNPIPDLQTMDQSNWNSPYSLGNMNRVSLLKLNST